MKKTVQINGVTVPADLSKKELFKFLKENKSALIGEKKSVLKESDAISVPSDLIGKYFVDKDGKIAKAAGELPTLAEGEPETVLCVINTTNWLDSHGDVHIPGIWNKSISDNPISMHLQEHLMKFTHIISDESKAYTQNFTWKELGLNFHGTTEALVFATPLKGRNPYMEEQYRKGYVKNHSVGMRYVRIKLCINEAEDEYYKEEYANWLQYAPMCVNIERAEELGFFWAVLEAKIAEGSAVPIGSNTVTPTLGFKSVQPEKSTEPNQPAGATGGEDEKQEGVNWDKIANLNFLTT